MNLKRTFENLSDEEKEQAKKATSMEEIEEVAESGGHASIRRRPGRGLRRCK